MASKPVPLLSRALTVLRSALGWEQTALAEAVGVRPSVISNYENGHRPLTREKLEEFARVMGLPAEAVDWAVGFVQSLRSVAQAPGYHGPPAEAERRQVEAIAAETGRLMTGFTRSLLGHVTIHSRALAARQHAAVLWGIMKRRGAKDRRVLVEDAQEFRNWGLCELMCGESIKAAADDAGRAVELAELAVLIADLAPGEETWRWRLQGYAGIHLANARRVRGNLPWAEEAFDPALKLWEAGAPGDPGLLSEAQVLSLEASLRIDQDRLLEAAALLDRALAANPGALRPNLLIQRARVLEWAGDYEGALVTLRQVGPLPPERQDLRQLWMLRQNPASLLCHLGQYAEAEALLPEIRVLTAQLDNKLDSLRLRWLEGRVAAGLERAAEAVAALSEVRAGFADLGIAYDAALVTLELAVVHLEQGRTREVKVLARQMAPIFQAQGVHRGALAALKLFCEAAEREAATVELARRVVDYLYRAQHDPELRFEAGR
jgi:transcriptional regulator with XRE-family HTH domain/tetratricopeptide (TPR) repeat protein